MSISRRESSRTRGHVPRRRARRRCPACPTGADHGDRGAARLRAPVRRHPPTGPRRRGPGDATSRASPARDAAASGRKKARAPSSPARSRAAPGPGCRRRRSRRSPVPRRRGGSSRTRRAGTRAVIARTSAPCSRASRQACHASSTQRSCSSRVQPRWTSPNATGQLVAMPCAKQEVAMADDPGAPRAHRFHVRVAVTPVSSVRPLRVELEPLVEEAIAGQIVVDARTPGGHGSSASAASSAPPARSGHVRPERVLAVTRPVRRSSPSHRRWFSKRAW